MPFIVTAELLMKKILEVLRETPRTEVVVASTNYVHAEATTLIMRFTDDFELYIDSSGNLLHFRSASRVGYSDFGANRKRVRAFKRKLADKLATTD